MDRHDNWTNFMVNYKKRFEDAFSEGGMTGIHSLVTSSLDNWRKTPINIAVTGESGAGKSSFINTLRDVYADDEDGAGVDVVQCTKNATPYHHPENDSLVIWDLPGVGTPKFPKKTYMKDVQFERYDCFIIISATRFTENDLWLAKTISARNHTSKEDNKKMFFFVRTKVDNDVSQRSHRRREPEAIILSRIRQDIEKTFKEKGFSDTPIFLIANYDTSLYDFDLLATKLVDESPAEKREAMALSLSVLTETVIERKKEAFIKRMWLVCMGSAVAGAVPIPGMSVLVDGALLVNEAIQYRRQFGLNQKELERSAMILQIPKEDIQKTLELESTALVLTVRGLATFCSATLISEYFETAARYSIPVFGSIVAGGVSFFATRHCLEKLLNVMVNDAKKINRKIKTMLESS